MGAPGADPLLHISPYLPISPHISHQEPILFGLSVEENVGYSLSAARAREGGGRVDFNDAAVRARVEEACRRANAHEFVGGLSDGCATLSGWRGICWNRP